MVVVVFRWVVGLFVHRCYHHPPSLVTLISGAKSESPEIEFEDVISGLIGIFL